MDRLTAIGLIFFLIILGAYIIIFSVQYKRHLVGTERLLVLNTRTALFLPVYAVFMLISLAKPEALAALTVPISIVEAYSFYSFFAMVVTNLHGPANAIAAFRGTGKELICCNSCCPTDHTRYYQKTLWALFHFLVTRNIIITIAAIGYYTHSSAGKAVYSIGNAIGTVILFYALIHIVLFYENVFNDCVNLFGIFKFALLKFSVGLIVLQGLVCEFMIQANAEPYNDDNNWSSEEKLQRGYCLLVLLEFVILVVPYMYTFLYQIDLPPKKPVESSSVLAPLTFGSYACQILKFHDIFSAVRYDESNHTQPLQPKY
eukprot:gene3558-3802_t